MNVVLLVIGIILGILVFAGLVILISDMLYYRKKENDEKQNSK